MACLGKIIARLERGLNENYQSWRGCQMHCLGEMVGAQFVILKKTASWYCDIAKGQVRIDI